MPMERALGEQEAGMWQAGSQEISVLSVSWAWSFSRSLSRPQLPDRLGRWSPSWGSMGGQQVLGTAGLHTQAHLPGGPAGPACSRQCPVPLSPL